jgi:nicotinamidase-related amidase
VLVAANGQAPGRTDSERPGGAMPADYADLVEELDAQARRLRITKQRWGPFYDTPLDGLLKENGVTRVIAVGVATSMGVESTARQPHEHGYNLVLATDAMTGRDAALHAHSLEASSPGSARRRP